MDRLDHALNWAKDRHATRLPRHFTPTGDRAYMAGPHKYRAQRYGWDGNHHTALNVRLLLRDQHGLCAYCGQPLDLYHADHIVPLSRGGGNDAANLALACPSCNMSKKDKSLLEWAIAQNSS